MHRTLTLLIGLTLLLLGASAASAATLDEELNAWCGYGGEQTALEDVLAAHGGAIVVRAHTWRSFEPEDPRTLRLLWFLGAIRTPEARTIASEVLAEGVGKQREMILGGIAKAPDWGGIELLLSIAETDPNAITHESAVALLWGIDFKRVQARASEGDADLSSALKARVAGLRDRETVERLRNYLEDILARWDGTPPSKRE